MKPMMVIHGDADGVDGVVVDDGDGIAGGGVGVSVVCVVSVGHDVGVSVGCCSS